MNARKSIILLLVIFVIVILSSSISETKGTLTTLSVTLVNPSNGSTVTGTPVSLTVLLQNTTTGRNCAGLTTSFMMYYLQTPGSPVPAANAYRPVGIATSGSDGKASLSYSPQFAGTYYWYITVYLKPFNGNWTFLRQPGNWTNAPNSNGGPWSFSTSALSTYTTALSTSLIYQLSSTEYTQTIPAETDISYLYQSITQYVTQSTTQTASFTSTQNYYATSISTSTAQLSTLTTPVTVFEMTTHSQTVLQSMTTTRYIYLNTHSPGANVNAGGLSQNQPAQLEARLSETVGSNLPPIVAVAGAALFCFTMLYRWRHRAKSGTGDAG